MSKSVRSRFPRLCIWAPLLILVTACSENGSTSPFLHEPVGADELAGSWLLRLPAAPACDPGLPPIGILMELERTWVPGVDNDGEREYLSGTWRVDKLDTEEQWLQGWIEPDRRRLHLLLWQGVHVRGSVLTAQIIAARVVEGRLEEPVPAYPGGGFATPSEGYPGGFTDSVCRWNVTGDRITD